MFVLYYIMHWDWVRNTSCMHPPKITPNIKFTWLTPLVARDDMHIPKNLPNHQGMVEALLLDKTPSPLLQVPSIFFVKAINAKLITC